VNHHALAIALLNCGCKGKTERACFSSILV
jgi:hypothetical protein